jgi:isopentenyl phosphate kinase
MGEAPFKCRHRKADRDFSHGRRLLFSRVVMMILRKSVKPLQSMVNEAMEAAEASPVTASAYSQARHKLSHSAFIELNQKAIVAVMYGDNTYRTFWGYRIVAVDGSKIRLPHTPEMCAAFGSHAYSVKVKDKETAIEGKHAMGLASVFYDVLNRVAMLTKSN